MAAEWMTMTAIITSSSNLAFRLILILILILILAVRLYQFGDISLTVLSQCHRPILTRAHFYYSLSPETHHHFWLTMHRKTCHFMPITIIIITVISDSIACLIS